ncbi:MAG TPA: winged helix-turn-helix domain-containing protein [Candidatus Nitrosotalea sp.]|nr:winged helix-turn-helix domain-containing protein [Candidatus Nitrosotalea sp.]
MPQPDIFAEQSVMGWGNRGWVEIVEMILEICEKGALKTHIMYKCNLNSKQIAQYLQFLQNHKLIEALRDSPSSKRPLFKTTILGEKYMAAYKQLENIFKKN